MDFKKIKIGDTDAAQLVEDGSVVGSVQDALDMMANGDERLIVVTKSQLDPEFFELKTRLAGEIMQKLVNYGVTVVVLGDFSSIDSKSLRDFIYECNSLRSRGGGMRFAADIEEAVTLI